MCYVFSSVHCAQHIPPSPAASVDTHTNRPADSSWFICGIVVRCAERKSGRSRRRVLKKPDHSPRSGAAVPTRGSSNFLYRWVHVHPRYRQADRHITKLTCTVTQHTLTHAHTHTHMRKQAIKLYQGGSMYCQTHESRSRRKSKQSNQQYSSYLLTWAAVEAELILRRRAGKV